jgi:hypothetical protein
MIEIQGAMPRISIMVHHLRSSASHGETFAIGAALGPSVKADKFESIKHDAEFRTRCKLSFHAGRAFMKAIEVFGVHPH